jgi:diaminopimelate epimerase
MKLDLPLQSGGVVDYVFIGVPHVVRFDAHIERVNVSRLGKEIRFDPFLAPDGANVNFCQQTGGDRLKLRTYERGLEAETLSCGSGAAAAAYIAHKKGMTGGAVEVEASGGSLTVHIEDNRMFLEGNPRIVYRGSTEEL